MTTADPFACFGDDDDSDGTDEVNFQEESEKFRSSGESTDYTNASGSGLTAGAMDENRERARRQLENHSSKEEHHSGNLRDGGEKINVGNLSTLSIFHSSFQDQKLRSASLPWPRNPPLYLGPMHLCQERREGGGRGYVATQDLPPGTCILIEEPIVHGWSDEQMGKQLGLQSIQFLFGMDCAQDVIGCMEELHPRKHKVDSIFQILENSRNEGLIDIASLDPLDRIQIVNMMDEMNDDLSHSEQCKSLVDVAKKQNIFNSDGSDITVRDINRLLLALRYNGFDSGLYLHFSMFNHNEDPNSIKFRPFPTGGHSDMQHHVKTIRTEKGPSLKINFSSNSGAKNNPHRIYSEARTTRYVQKGEALTLHYLENPREVSHFTRQRILWDQHRFDIGNENEFRLSLLGAEENGKGSPTISQYDLIGRKRKEAIYQSEIVLGNFPSSFLQKKDQGNCNSEIKEAEEQINVIISSIEKSLDDLDDIVTELQTLHSSDQLRSSNLDPDHFDRATSLELALWELITSSESALGNCHHILLSRCRRLHLDAIELVLLNYSPVLTNKQSIAVMSRFLYSVQPLLESQRLRLGNDHPDVARTCHDFAMGIQALLSHAPRRLLSLKIKDMSTLEQCSLMENKCRKEKERIDALYPDDVNDILNLVQRPGDHKG